MPQLGWIQPYGVLGKLFKEDLLLINNVSFKFKFSLVILTFQLRM